jgi:hypothetical protein
MTALSPHSMLLLSAERWQSMKEGCKRIMWPGQKPRLPDQVIVNDNGEEELVSADTTANAPTQAAILGATLRCAS